MASRMMSAMLEFKVEVMSCGHCAAVVTQAVKAVDPQAKVEVDLGGHTVRVETVSARDAIAKALADAGYPPG